jgi:tetratricopeptide (TPR) repeat protein
MIGLTAVRAQSEQDRRDCFSVGTKNYDSPSFYDTGLAACDKFVKSGRFSGTDLQPYVKQRADWLRRKGELAAALRDFAWAIELNPNDVENYDFRGDVYVERGEYDLAIADYNTSIRIKPDYAPAYYSRGLAHEKAGRIEEAVASFRQAARLSPPATGHPNTIRLYEWGINSAKKKLEQLGR